MDDFGLQFLAQQLGYRIPTLLACAFGIVLALIYLRRCRLSALLTMLATGVMAMTSLGTAFVQYLLIQAQRDGGAGPNVAQFGQMMSLVGVLSSVVDAAALALLVIAVFVGRRGEDS